MKITLALIALAVVILTAAGDADRTMTKQTSNLRLIKRETETVLREKRSDEDMKCGKKGRGCDPDFTSRK